MGRRTEIVRSVCALARERGVGGGVGRREGYTPELWPHSRSLTLPESQPLPVSTPPRASKEPSGLSWQKGSLRPAPHMSRDVIEVLHRGGRREGQEAGTQALVPGRRSAHKGTVGSPGVVCCLSAHLSSVASPTFSRTTSGRASRVYSDIAALTGSARAAQQSIAQSTTNASGSPSSPQTRMVKRSRVEHMRVRASYRRGPRPK